MKREKELKEKEKQIRQRDEQLQQRDKQLQQRDEQLRCMASVLSAKGMTVKQIAEITGIGEEEIAVMLG